MTIKELKVNIIGGMGGPNGDSIPIYSDNKAPNGGQVYGPNGMQLMLANTEISGIQYIIVDPQLLTKEENANGLFLSYKSDGTVNYARMWIYDPETGHGEQYAPGIDMWAEYSHLERAEDDGEPPVEPPMEGDFSIFVIDWDARTVTLKPE